jgi:peptidoglycan/LPS O-acetylase OafA/YrhL
VEPIRGVVCLFDLPALCVARPQTKRATVDTCWAATGIVLPDAEDNLGILRIMPEFLLGIGLYYVGQTLNPSKAQAVGFAITCTIALLGAMQFDFDDRVIVAIAGPFIVSLAFLSKANVTTFLSRPALLFWGEASFALYLVHMPAIMIWRNIVSKLYGLPHEYKMAWPELACLLAVTLALAAALHIWIERPGRFVIRAALMKPKTRQIASS